jgi:hypothetical protein
MTEVLEESGIDSDTTPVDRLPEHSAWALVGHFAELNGENPDE